MIFYFNDSRYYFNTHKEERKIKIGEFAKKHTTTQATIRHYIDIGLLSTDKKGSHYEFNSKDSKDMETITFLKCLDFSLPEIQEILKVQRLSGVSTDQYINKYLSLLEAKKIQIDLIQDKYEKMSKYLNETINQLNIEKLKERNTLKKGFPINSISLLQCPKCLGMLKLIDGTIENNYIVNGLFNCSCGYDAVIENGIYIKKDSMKNKLLDGMTMPSSEEYINVSSPDIINFRYNSMNSLTKIIEKYTSEPNYILELNYCVGFFLAQHIEYLSPNSTYILIDYDINRIRDLKSNLETSHKEKEFIFICCDIDEIPFKNSAIDLIVDYWMIKDFGKTEGKFLLDFVIKYLKTEGAIAGVYPYVNQNQLKKIKNEYACYFNKDMIMSNMSRLDIEEIESLDVGPILSNNKYHSDIMGLEVYQRIYLAKHKNK